ARSLTVGDKTISRDLVPVKSRELAVIALLVLLFDLVVYRGQGYSGYAVGFVLTPILLWAGAPRRGLVLPGLVIGVLLAVLAARMAWLGSVPQLLFGLLLVAALSRTLAGRTPYVLDTIFAGCLVGLSATYRLPDYAQRRSSGRSLPRAGWLKVLMPAVVVLMFGVVFIQANPDLKTTIDEILRSGWDWITALLGDLFPSLPRLLCWLAVAWLSIGLLRPIALPRALGWLGPVVDGRTTVAEDDNATVLIPAFCNTLLAVNLLFAVYLVFEFQTLWFREFPTGFYFAGYAHQGAAWLTVALAMATLLLSAIFRGRVLGDARLGRLKRLAWVWSGLNLLLAVAVYHRLSIYIDFNGMTRMRTVGLVGVTTVLVGFVLVVWKIARNRGFLWLIERQLWALVMGLYLLTVLPIDALIQQYNVRRILSGDPAPVVQITEHEVDAGGLAALEPLLKVNDVVIQRGIAARLFQAHEQLSYTPLDQQHWTARQGAERRLLDQLAVELPRLTALAGEDRDARWQSLRDYAFQWY
ncbi:MAG: DUF4153 domain-containing protein, partial [Planctomycetaceae bacterium]